MKQKIRRRLQNISVIILISLCLGWVVYRFWGFASNTFTDNARVEELIVPVNCRVLGFIEDVRFNDFTKVKKGDTLLVIENAEYALKLAQAKADMMTAIAGKEALGKSISATLSNVAASDAQIVEIEALLNNAKLDMNRYAKLLEKGALTQYEYDKAKSNHDALQAKADMLSRQRASISMGSQEQTVRLEQSEAAIEIAKAALRIAELNMSYTVVVAPCDGYCSRREVQKGQLIQPGQTIVYIVDTNDIWVTANYREKQVSRMAVGDSVKITVDAIAGVSFKGVVSDISAATGEQFSPQAHSHAVGNFVKVEQRIPVKIRFTGNNSVEDMSKLRAGMNAECKTFK